VMQPISSAWILDEKILINEAHESIILFITLFIKD
jgi:hypothetical protein